MANFPSLTPEKLIKILEKKGFKFIRAKGSHQIFRNFETKKMTVVPMHKKDLPKGTMEAILKQCGIKRSEILDLI
jgi:predicted RNA binding protein YcfA (HicA-like mRNA interferase family)